MNDYKAMIETLEDIRERIEGAYADVVEHADTGRFTKLSLLASAHNNVRHAIMAIEELNGEY